MGLRLVSILSDKLAVGPMGCRSSGALSDDWVVGIMGYQNDDMATVCLLCLAPWLLWLRNYFLLNKNARSVWELYSFYWQNTDEPPQHDCMRACQLQLMSGSGAVSHFLLKQCQQPAEQSAELNAELNPPQQIMHECTESLYQCDHNSGYYIIRINKWDFHWRCSVMLGISFQHCWTHRAVPPTH